MADNSYLDTFYDPAEASPAREGAPESYLDDFSDPPGMKPPGRESWTDYSEGEPTFMKRMGAEWQHQGYVIERGLLGEKAMRGALSPEDQRNRDWLKANRPGEIPNAPGPLDDFIGPGFGMIRLLWEGVLPHAAAGAGIGAAVGAAGGAIFGPGAALTAGAGAITGGKVGAAYSMYRLEGGNAFEDYLETAEKIKAKTGEEVPHAAIVGAAVATGAVNAGFEMISLTAISKLPGISVLTRQLNRGGIQRLLQNPSTRNKLAELGRSYMKIAGLEGGTEGLQETTTLGVGEFLRRATTSSDVGKIGWDEVIEQVGHSMKQGALAGGGIAVATGAPSTALDIAAPKRAFQRDLQRHLGEVQKQAEAEGLDKLGQETRVAAELAKYAPQLAELQGATEEVEAVEEARTEAEEILAPEPTVKQAQDELGASEKSLREMLDAGDATKDDLEAANQRVNDARGKIKTAEATAKKVEAEADQAQREREKVALKEAEETAEPVEPEKAAELKVGEDKPIAVKPKPQAKAEGLAEVPEPVEEQTPRSDREKDYVQLGVMTSVSMAKRIQKREGKPYDKVDDALIGKVKKKFGQEVADLAEKVRRADVAVPVVEGPVDEAAHEAATSPLNEKSEPTPAQIDAGNYEKGHLPLTFAGKEILIENPEGSIRKSKPGAKKKWSQKLAHHYGYIAGTKGVDGDPTDVFVKPGTQSDFAGSVFVIDQIDQATGKFDEHKVMVGFKNMAEAKKAYAENYEKGWKIGQGTRMNAEQFNEWLKGPVNLLKPANAKTKVQAKKKVKKKKTKKAVKAEIEEAKARRDEEAFKREMGRKVSEPPSYEQTQLEQAEQELARWEASLAEITPGPTAAVDKARAQKMIRNAKGRIRRLRAKTTPLGPNEEIAKATPAATPTGAVGATDAQYAKLGELSSKALALKIRKRAGQVWDEKVDSALVEDIKERFDEEAANLARTIRYQDSSAVKPNIRKAGVGRVFTTTVGAIPLSAAQGVVDAALDVFPGLGKVTVVADIDELSEDIRDLTGDSNLRGLYNVGDDHIYIVADQHVSPADVYRTLLHEGVAHKGLRAMLSNDELKTVLDGVIKRGNPKVMAAIKADYNLSDSLLDRRIAAEEYIAHLAELEDTTGVLGEVIAVIRKALRRAGIVTGWSDNDIRALLRETKRSLATTSRLQKENQEIQVRFALTPAETRAIDADPTSSDSRYSKVGAILHDAQRQKERGKNSAKYIVGKLMDGWEGYTNLQRKATLFGAPARMLGEFIRTMPNGVKSAMEVAFDGLQHEKDLMEGTFSKFANQFSEPLDKLDKFVRKNAAGAITLYSVMHGATIGRTDPAMPYVAEFNVGRLRIQAGTSRRQIAGMEGPERAKAERSLAAAESMIASEQQRRKDWVQLKDAFYALPEEGQAVYRTLRDQYQKMHALLEKHLTEKITELSGKAGAPVDPKVLDRIKQAFELNAIGAPYFPLTRFGDYVAVAKGEKGEVMAVSQFESRRERRAWVAEQQEAGFKVTQSDQSLFRNNPSGMASSVDTNFARDVVSHLVTFPKEGGEPVQKFPGALKLADDVWQMYLSRLPEFSARKASMHRKGTLGFATDARRAYAYHSFVTARALSKTIHGHRIDAALKKVHDGAIQLVADSDGKATWAVPIATELSLRHEWQMNPTAQPMATLLTKMGFHAFLGFNLSSAAVNFTQSWIVGVPILGAEYGVQNAARELSIASNHMRHKRENWHKYLSEYEMEIMEALEDLDVFGKTRTHELLDSAHTLGGGNLALAEWASSFAFSTVEVHNRQLTALAAIRSAQKANPNISRDDLTREAWKMDWMIHFDYSNANRPRIMQGSVGRVALLFRNYSFNMAYRMGKDLVDSVNWQEMDPTRKRAAKKRLAGMMGTTMLAAGVRGLPLTGIAAAGITLAYGDDDPIDVWDEVRQYLSEMMGETVANVALEGPISALTKVDVSHRLSLSNLFFREAPPELQGRELRQHWAGEATGPLGAYLSDILRGGEAMIRNENDEKWRRGLELMLPLQTRNVAKALRYMLEDGVKGWHGQEVMPEGEDLAFWKKAMQATGFSPYDLNLRYEKVGAVYGIQERLKNRRNLLRNRKRDAIINKDRDRLKSASADIREWNRIQIKAGRGRIRITGRDVSRSVRSKRRASREYLGGRRFDAMGRELVRQRGLER